MDVNVDSLQKDDGYFVALPDSVWLMDNHKWALAAWLITMEKSGFAKYTLAHADYHWDDVYDMLESPEVQQRFLAANLNGVLEFIEEEHWIRYDSFIAPAVARGMFDTVHFFCKQDGGSDVGLPIQLLASTGVAQVIHQTPEEFASLHPTSPLIFDLCLDLFNKSTQFQQGDLWSDEEVLGFMNLVRPLIVDASAVTISLSFDCSGTADDTRHLAALVLPLIAGWRASARS